MTNYFFDEQSESSSNSTDVCIIKVKIFFKVI